ncbi:DNA repair protein RecO [Thermoclostridium stercorarium subsp. stercorarium DSM 8532]|jgi:DNA repair protein RecO (recombination protein O)|uniref:DNA repair protein RecO n=3 Tax=Thermoclostridium stercorarium TaxID=1510 RepID=L7VQQ8_THES1|nr:DNA repair protein RecO [Thermoclostridium stercorarium]AGC69014.1 DNA repair protein RecO [Thermoclostridium stercorarium subsp. stercorarium DSM 8532]AGI39992.1 RecO [Thermoclostridium stercorarium subsp. stercorarium DSM 8532]ANW99311.1 DNA repair protein RecO [Thermoclostridium stercorarium subsp. thermolacticum DSM 2910]ANX01940.1 DNA repair protein RecO [Thermoclostridium stercorarium subsp. leptospartum DSM 9219]UZQ84982.1 DNA repair protein RecO [Thermoclostridium stercorarium]
MPYVKARGIVVREVKVGDYDKILTVVTEEFGKISVSARGVRRGGNRYSAGTQIFSYCDWVLYKGKNTYVLNSCEIISSFYEIRQDMTLLAYAAHMLRLLNDATYENQPAKDLITVFLYALRALLNKRRTPSLVARAFALKTIQMMGFVPHVSGCCVCGTKEINDIYFNFRHCGFVCEKCNTTPDDALRVKTGAAKAIIYVLCAEPAKVFDFELAPEVLKNFEDIVDRYVDDRLEKEYSKMDFLQEI